MCSAVLSAANKACPQKRGLHATTLYNLCSLQWGASCQTCHHSCGLRARRPSVTTQTEQCEGKTRPLATMWDRDRPPVGHRRLGIKLIGTNGVRTLFI